MGIMTRKIGEQFLITSDRLPEDKPLNRAPARVSEVRLVWTGNRWSEVISDAQAFASLDDADEYTRAHYAQLSGKG